MKRAIAIFMLTCCVSANLTAHEMRPAYLELRETAADTYSVLWKVSGTSRNERLDLKLAMPADCRNVTPPRMTVINNAYVERWIVECDGGLAGKEITALTAL